MASDFKASPGPDVLVAARHPANEAPMAVEMPAISSSDCITFTPTSLRLANSCMMSEAGVMG